MIANVRKAGRESPADFLSKSSIETPIPMQMRLFKIAVITVAHLPFIPLESHALFEVVYATRLNCIDVQASKTLKTLGVQMAVLFSETADFEGFLG